MDPPPRESACTPHRVLVIRIPAVDDDIIFLYKRSDAVQGFLDDVTGWNHEPNGSRRGELVDK
jgi:hypothetical protein